jgi:hypothetical protein
MALTFTNSSLTQIAIKRLSGKAHTNSNSSIPEEKFGSTVQVSAETVFGESVPNAPSQTLWEIQSASLSSPGTAQYVEFLLEKIIGADYQNSDSVDNNGSYADQSVYGSDVGKTGGAYEINTYHAYYVKLPSNYESNSTGFDSNASTDVSLGTGQFSNNYASTGSTQFQIIPEYLSTITGTSNAYIPTLYSTNDTEIVGTSPIDWYLDTFAGILFVQNPLATYDTDSNNNVPEKLRAFLYVGKYQSEIAGGDSVSLHFSASSGDGFSITNETTASFITGSTSGGGLSIQANVGNVLSFTLNGVISSSAQFEGPTTINITASYAESASEVGITDLQDNAFHPIVFTFDPLGSAPAGGTTTFEKLAISNDSSTSNQGLYYNPQDADLRLVDNDNDFLSIKPNQIVADSDVNSFTILSNTPIINLGGSGTNGISIGGDDHGTTTTAIGTFKVNSWDAVTQDVYNSTVTGSFGIDLVHPNTGSFIISNISESTERTPLVIDNNGNVTKADSDFATYIVGEGGGLDSMNIEEGAAQGQIKIQSSSNGVTSTFEQIDVNNLGTDDTPQFVGIEATNTTFNLATVQESAGNQTINIGNSSNNGNQIVLNGTASITGDLIVQGATTTLNTTNLLVEDKFILLNSGSTGTPGSEGGIIVQTQPNADGGKGTSMYYDSTLNRWLITSASFIEPDASSINGNLAVAGKKAAIVTVQVDGGIPSTTPLFGSTDDYRLGQMYVDTNNTDGDFNNIWVYA